MRLYPLFISLLLLPICSSAAIYKWTDAQGNVHYSQQKPKSATTELQRLKINARAPGNLSTYRRPGTHTEKEVENKSAQTDNKTEKKKKKLSPKQRARYCASARRNLQTLRSRAQIKQRDKKGSVRFITEKEKQAKIRQAQKFVNKNCR